MFCHHKGNYFFKTIMRKVMIFFCDEGKRVKIEF